MKSRVPPIKSLDPRAQVRVNAGKVATSMDDTDRAGEVHVIVDNAADSSASARAAEPTSSALDTQLIPPPQVSEQAGGSPGGPMTRSANAPLLAKLPPSHLSTRQASDIAFCARVDGKVRKKATSILEMSLSGADIDDPSEEQPVIPRPTGWTAKRFRIAKDARKPLKQQPGYLAAAQRMVESYKRAESALPVAPVLNAEVVQVHVDARTYNYRVVDVTDHEKG